MNPRDRDASNRIFRIALALSLLAHLIVGFLVYAATDDVRRVFARVAARPTPPPNETVSLSTAFRIEKRARPRPRAQTAPAPPRPQRRPAPARAAVVPHPIAVHVPVPLRHPPVPHRHELAKVAPHATPQPPVAKATAPPQPRAKIVASIERPPKLSHAAPVRPSTPRRFSEAQLAAIQNDLAKTIVRSRIENNPMSNVSKPVRIAAATHHYAIDFAALAGSMREGQGLCDPVKSWESDGWDYYYATCTIQEPDGSTSRKPMPWPVRWRPRNDPWNGTSMAPTGPMPLPPPGWHSSAPIDPDYLFYLRRNGYPI